MTRARIYSQPFKDEHIDLMCMRQHEQETLTRGFTEALAKSGTARTHTIDGRILCIAGYVELWKGVREVYVIPSIYTHLYALPFQRAVKGQLDAWLNECHRLQTHSRPEEDRWMESLGFSIEGILENYTSNKLSYRMWARLNNGS